MPTPTLTTVECRDITKRFGGTTALDGVTVAFHTGEVHALVGENGAGKSTLGKALAGVHQPDHGQIVIDDEPVDLRSPKAALDRGITMVAQELSLVPTQTVLDNVFLGMEATRFGIVRTGDLRRKFDELVERFGMHADPLARVSDLSVADQQMVEILRALARNANIIVMDEPTARLSHSEATQLGRNVRDLAAQGLGIVYVSHFLDEVLDVADTITVLRNGALVRTGDAANETKASLVEGIAGRSLDAAFPVRQPVDSQAPIVLDVRGLSREGHFDDVSFHVRAGEIVTLAGLVGAGRTEVARTVFGADQPTAGTMQLNGETYEPRSPRQAIQAGIGMIPESRRSQGLFFQRNVMENVSLAHLDQFTTTNVVTSSAERNAAQAVATSVELRGATIDSRMDELSGGNQQKVMFARWLVDAPQLLIADEPTRGVDVGAKRAIYDMLVDLAGQGMAILVVSSELDEVLGLAHRVLVMRNGSLVAELDASTATDSEVMTLAFGATTV